MENTVKTRLQSVQLAEPQIYKNIAIVPLVAPVDGAFQYNTLGEALGTSNLAISEVSAGGSVPELMVANRGDAPVLLVDGEELAGAKQNRVLNTSILIKESSETKIPVSCTEQGRWAYSTRFFSESGHIMAHTSRSKKSSSVQRALQASGQYSSDQGEVWEEIACLHAKAGSHSPTSAMSDVYKAREEDLRKSDDVFKAVANQVGILVLIDGAPAGADLVSRTAAYLKLHPKLVRSYTLESLLVATKSGEGELQPKQDTSATPNLIAAEARRFLDEVVVAEEQQFPSVGHGTDYRYRAKNLAGSALVHANEVIHAAFFRLDNPEQPERMAWYRHRSRRFQE
jgi:hypothetical protein